jgi:regulator of nucleoside diphosphate kinase
MRTTTEQPVLSKIDHGIIMNYLKSNQARTLFNRFDAEDLLAEINKAKLVDDNKMPADIVRLNSTVKVYDEDAGKLVELTLVTPKMANIKENKISVMSPVGIALIGCRKGHRVVWKVPLGKKHFKIVDVKQEPAVSMS